MKSIRKNNKRNEIINSQLTIGFLIILFTSIYGCSEKEINVVDINSSIESLLLSTTETSVRLTSELSERLPERNRSDVVVRGVLDSLIWGYYKVPESFQMSPYWLSEKSPFIFVDEKCMIFVRNGDGQYLRKKLIIFDGSFSLLATLDITNNQFPHILGVYDKDDKGRLIGHTETIPEPFISLSTYSLNDIFHLLNWREYLIKNKEAFRWEQSEISPKSYLGTFIYPQPD
ncbi:MAG: hypothetical protein R3C61_20350 [Bacteroidia bacterium]